MFAEEVPQVSVLRKFNDHIEWTILRAHSKKIDDVHVATDDLHHVHLGHQVYHLCICVALLQHLHCHHMTLSGTLEIECLCLKNLSESSLTQGFAET